MSLQTSKAAPAFESKQGHPLLDQMVNPDVRDDMPIADFTTASSSRGFGPHEESDDKIGFSGVMLERPLPTWKTHTRTYNPCSQLVRFLSVTNNQNGRPMAGLSSPASPPLPPAKKERRTWETHKLVYCLCNASYALDGFPLVLC